MKKIHIVLLLLSITLFNGIPAKAKVNAAKAIEQTLSHEDTVFSAEPGKPIIKTVVIEEEEKEGELSSRDKWITGILAAFGFVGVLVFRLLRKKKKVEKKPE